MRRAEAGTNSGHSPEDVLLVTVGPVVRTIGQQVLDTGLHISASFPICSYLFQTSAMGLHSGAWVLAMHCPMYCLTHGCKRRVKKKELEKEDVAAKGTPNPGSLHGSLHLSPFCSQGRL